jgi:hypothetical protein
MTESPQANTTPLAAIGHQQMQPPGGAPSSTPAEPQEDLSTKYDKKLAELTSKFDGLSRRERMLLQKEREIQEKSSHVEQYENLKELAKKSPAQLLEKFGITYDQLTDYYASQTPEDETSRTVGSLKQELAELKKQMEVQKTEGQAKEIAKVREQKLEALKNLANKDDSPYGLISQFGSYEDVLIYMGQHYQATGEILDDQTAMEAVEKQLEENLKVLAKSNKVRKLLGFDQAISSPEVQSHKSITLSNNFGSEAPRTQDTRGLSEAQLFELALQQMPDLK